MNGIGGLLRNDLVMQINECSITDVGSWQECLVRALHLSTPGYCLHSEFIKEYDESVPGIQFFIVVHSNSSYCTPCLQFGNLLFQTKQNICTFLVRGSLTKFMCGYV